MNCCGTESYKDWFATSFGNGTDVPDTCCLLISEGCGKDIINAVDPADDIETEVSLLVLYTTWINQFSNYNKVNPQYKKLFIMIKINSLVQGKSLSQRPPPRRLIFVYSDWLWRTWISSSFICLSVTHSSV